MDSLPPALFIGDGRSRDPHRFIRSTVYLPASSVAAVRAHAARRNVSSAALIRAAVDSAVLRFRPPPNGGFL